jgi:hypothetical protein
MYYYTTILQCHYNPLSDIHTECIQALRVSCKQYTEFIPKRNAIFEHSSPSPSHLKSYTTSSPRKVHLLISSHLLSRMFPCSYIFSRPPLPNPQAKSNPKPFIQARYLVTISAHAAWGSLAVENSMHSSRAAFSSLHTQQGLTLGAPSSPGGLFEEARLLIWEEALA